MEYDVVWTDDYYRLCINNKEGQIVIDMLYHDGQWDAPLLIVSLREPSRPRSINETTEILSLIDTGWHWANILRLQKGRAGWHPRMENPGEQVSN